MTGARNDLASGAGGDAGMSVQTRCDPATGRIEASLDIAASPERVFRALTSEEICSWWVRPGVFDTRQWSGDLRPGGCWRASGLGNGRPYGLEGEFREVDPPAKLVHTWQVTGAPMPPTLVTYRLQPLAGGTQLRLEHSGFAVPEACVNTSAGWETSFRRLAELLTAENAPAP